jgi:transketolase
MVKVHGAPLGVDEVAAVKKKLGFDPEKFFFVPEDVKRHYGAVRDRGMKAENDWNALFQKYAAEFPQMVALYYRNDTFSFL